MEKLYSNIVGTFVVESDDKRPIAVVKDLVMDTEKGKVVAFLVNRSENLVVAPVDVISWGDLVVVDGADAVAEGDDIVRVAEVQKKGVYLAENRVETLDGEYLGKVTDYTVDSKTYDLKNIYVAKSILGLVRLNPRIIGANKIVEIKRDKVVVEANMETVAEEEKMAVAEDLSAA